MSDAWEQAEQASKEADQGGEFFKLGDGDSARVVFTGAPGPKKTTTAPWGEISRYPTPLYNLESKCAQTWDLSSTVLKELLRVRRKHGVDCVYEVERVGSGLDTEYRLDHLGQLTDEIRAAMGTPVSSDRQPDAEPTQTAGADDDIPF